MNEKFPKDGFNLRESKGPDFYSVMIVNEALKGYQYKGDFPWFLYFDIEIKETTEKFALPSDEEAKVLNYLEDKISDIIKATVSSHFIGRITENGHRELFFYVESPEEIHERLQELVTDEHQVREWEYSIEEDPEWSNVEFFFDY
ncbi:MAG TPA: DUF695 domain-containing protein [Chryseolinea sp.]